MRPGRKPQGRTHVTVRQGRDRTLRHVDPNDPLHAADHVRFSAAYRAARERERDQPRERPTQTLKFPSLGGGFMLDSEGNELTSAEHFGLLKSAQEGRGWYWQETKRADGTLRLRKVPTDAVHLLALTVRPDYAAALAFLSSHPKGAARVRPFLVRALRLAAEEFQAATGLEPLALQCHPEEGTLHGHLAYSSVSGDNRLLWTRSGKGRKGLRLLGPSHCGTLRLAEAGYLSDNDAALARNDLADRVRHNLGEDPVDLRLGRLLDGLCEQFFAGGLRKVFVWAADRYRRDLAARRTERPDALKAAKKEAEHERDRLAAEVVQLRAEIARLAAMPPVFAPPPSQPAFAPGLLPPLPQISLTRTGPSGPPR